MVDGFCAMGDRCDSACGIWEHSHSVKEVKCLQCYLNTFLWVYKNLKLSPVAIGHSLVVIIPDWILWVASFQSLFYVTCIQNQWGHTLAVQVQWQDGILICFDSECCVKNRWGGGRKRCFVNICSLAVF